MSNGERAQLYRQAYMSTIETQWAMPSLSRTVLFLDDVISSQAYCFVLVRLVILMVRASSSHDELDRKSAKMAETMLTLLVLHQHPLEPSRS